MSNDSAVAAGNTIDIQAVAIPPSWTRHRAEVLAAVSILLGAAGQLVVKGALLLLNAHHADSGVAQNLLQPFGGVLCGLAVYALGTWFWLKAVAKASISYLYPLSAGSYALVALGGRFIFGESIQAARWIGIAVIMSGVALLALSSDRGAE